MKVALGLVIIVISFIYLIKNPSQSMMDGLMKKRQKSYEELQAKLAAQEAEKAEMLQQNEENSASSENPIQ